MRIKYYVLSVLTIMVLVSSATENTVSITQNSVEDTGETYEDLLKQIQAWEESKNWEELVEILMSVKQWASQKSQNNDQETKLSMFFFLLNRMDYHYTGVYRTPRQGNVLPKTTIEGIFSGMSSASIKDPEVRKQYEKDLEENEKENKKAQLQMGLRNRRESWLNDIIIYLMNNYKDEKEMTKLIDDNVIKEKSRKELKEILDEKIQATEERMRNMPHSE